MGFEGHARGSREYRRILLALFFAGIATFAQLYSVQGVLPLVARDLSVAPAQAALTVSAATIGLAIGVLPWSWAADRWGRLPVMRLSLGAAVVAGLIVPVMPGLGSLLAVRVVQGFALGGVPAIAVTYLHEEISRGVSAVAAGTYVSGTTLGGLLGRVVAAPLGELWGWRAGILVVALVSAAATVVFALLVPRAQGFVRRDSGATRVALPRVVARQLRNPGLLVLFAQGLLLMGGFVAVYNYLSFRLEAAPFRLTASQSALLFFAYLAGTVSSRVAGSLVVRLGRHTVLVSSIAVMVAGVLLTLVPHVVVIVVGLIVLTAGFFGAHSVASGWVGARARPEHRAQAASLYNLFYYAGSSVVGWAAGFAFAGAGWPGVVTLVAVLAVAAATWAAIDGTRSRAVARESSESPESPESSRSRADAG
ncbi:MFS transporter [Frondihabitans australicus]|uniref:Putative MFS family arabinose efflux permease n=1 Tax=Frondihabitans australicus TaxID=386892 RepID=A0A495IKU2_9MICO|nr:MFS transporter [Frondihabitans australicus]RKR76553.1 putative MFS family arabinose efflux permease [Frondihabitans australicus]